MFQTLPYADGDTVYRSPSYNDIRAYTPKQHFCPSRRAPQVTDSGFGAFDYYGSSMGTTGVFRRFDYARLRLSGVKDGTSNTIMIGEKNVCLDNLGTEAQPVERRGYAWGWGYGDPAGNWDCTLTNSTVAPQPDRVGCTDGSHGFGSSHPGVFQGAMADGSVKVFRYESFPAGGADSLIDLLSNVADRKVIDVNGL